MQGKRQRGARVVFRAGLDADPGYLPWLGRKLVLEFEEGMAPVDRAG